MLVGSLLERISMSSYLLFPRLRTPKKKRASIPSRGRKTPQNQLYLATLGSYKFRSTKLTSSPDSNNNHNHEKHPPLQPHHNLHHPFNPHPPHNHKTLQALLRLVRRIRNIHPRPLPTNVRFLRSHHRNCRSF